MEDMESDQTSEAKSNTDKKLTLREWAQTNGFPMSKKGKVSSSVLARYRKYLGETGLE